MTNELLLIAWDAWHDSAAYMMARNGKHIAFDLVTSRHERCLGAAASASEATRQSPHG
jgi:hypothetical protein